MTQPEFILLDNKFLPTGSLMISADNRCFRYGDGLFETMRFFNNQLLLWPLHMERLHRGLELLHFKNPLWGSSDQLLNHILQLIKLNGHQSAARIRLQVFRGDGNLGEPDDSAHYVVQSFTLTGISAMNKNGRFVGIHPHVKKSCDVFSGIKSCNFLPYTQASFYARSQGWNDCLVLNQFDRICDASVANVFWVRNNNVFTPSLGEGPVAGVFRSYLLQFLKGKGFTIAETTLDTETLSDADEVFLTNAVKGIQSVSRIGDKQYGRAVTNEIQQLVSWT
jgi:branched-chain amino acid aminotransferase